MGHRVRVDHHDLEILPAPRQGHDQGCYQERFGTEMCLAPRHRRACSRRRDGAELVCHRRVVAEWAYRHDRGAAQVVAEWACRPGR